MGFLQGRMRDPPSALALHFTKILQIILEIGKKLGDHLNPQCFRTLTYFWSFQYFSVPYSELLASVSCAWHVGVFVFFLEPESFDFEHPKLFFAPVTSEQLKCRMDFWSDTSLLYQQISFVTGPLEAGHDGCNLNLKSMDSLHNTTGSVCFSVVNILLVDICLNK